MATNMKTTHSAAGSEAESSTSWLPRAVASGASGAVASGLGPAWLFGWAT
jgi:hypothetical protein